jgi:hypothetical protein
MAPTEQEEADFMAALLSDDVFNSSLKSDNRKDDFDMAAFTQGAEQWAPKKYVPDTCTRCVVEVIVELEIDGRYQKVGLLSRKIY